MKPRTPIGVTNDTLAFIMPAYNESEGIVKVVRAWYSQLTELGIDFKMIVYNDASKDNTLSVLRTAAKSMDRLVVCDKPNSGHGPTILQGYRENSQSGWLFQSDSDGEMDPKYFPLLWKKRKEFDFLVGRRVGRQLGFSRQCVSAVSRLIVFMLYGRNVYDVNSPYRLMKSSLFRDSFFLVPQNTFAPNVIITGLANYLQVKVYEIDVPFHFRETGEVSIKRWKLFKAAALSLLQTVSFRFHSALSVLRVA